MIKQYANYLDNEKENISDVMGNLSTITGIMSDISELPGVSKVSQVIGVIKLNSDIKKVKENPSVSTVSDVIIDGIGFIPNGGAIASYGLSEIKEAGEQVYQHEKEYQKQEIIEKFSNLKNTDLGHNIEKSVRQDIINLFRGNK